MSFNEATMKLEAAVDSGFSLSRVPVQQNIINILVGLGGSGVDMLREAKGLINRVCCDDNDRRRPPKRVVYLGIDTDTSYLDSPWICSNGREARLRKENPGSEQVNFENIHLPTFLDPANLDVSRRQYPYIFDWLNPEIRGSITGGDSGASGVPQAGRAYLFLNLPNIQNRLTELINTARSGETITGYNVFLMSGVSGGTGCGTYQDMAYALRKMVRDLVGGGASVRVFGHLIMPDVNMMEAGIAKDYVPLNGYTSLAGLDHLTSLKSNKTRFQQQMAPGFVVDTDEPPFDYVHLFSHEDDGGHTPENYYKHCMASGAQNILSFVARETINPQNLNGAAPGSSNAVFAMDSLYSNIPRIEHLAQKRFPERSYKYLSAGVAEYALPMEDILRYVTTLLFNRMDSLFQNEPAEAEADRVMSQLGLRQNEAIAGLCSQIPNLVETTNLNKSAVFGANAIDFTARFNRFLQDAEQDIDKKAEAVKNAFGEKLRSVLSPYFVDPKFGPVWVNHLLIYHLIPKLNEMIAHENTTLRGFTQRENDCEAERTRISGKFIKTNEDAKAFAAQWNDQFRARIECYAAKHLLRSVEDDPSIARVAVETMDAMNSKWFRVVTEILTTLRRVSNANAEIVATAQLVNPNNFVWGAISVPQISEAIKDQFDRLDSTSDLVGDFTKALLAKADEWSIGQIDVASFLEQYFQTSLREIIDQTMEDYLDYILVRQGPYKDLNTALQDLFTNLKDKATPMFHCSDAAPRNTKQYLLSVPASCTRIVAAAEAFKAANTTNSVVVQYSQVNFRISMQSVRCAIPMFAYDGLKRYENLYYAATPVARRGCRLYDGAKANWELLPSPIPRKSRGARKDDTPEPVRKLESDREKAFYALLKTPAMKLEPVEHIHDYNCVFYPSQKLDECGVYDLWQDRNLKDYDGEWDRKKIEEVLKTLQNYLTNGLPAAASIVTQVGGGTLARRIVILEECSKFADGAYLAQINEMLDTPEKEEAFIKACQQAAVEFYLASMPTFEQGQKELEKYETLDAQIRRLQGILDEMNRLPTECRQLLQILLTGQVELSEQGDRFLYRDTDGNLVSGIDLKCKNTVIKEWELLQQLRALAQDENPHRSSVAARIISQAAAAYNSVKSSRDREAILSLLADLEELARRIGRSCVKHSEALARGDGYGYLYTARGLEFYQAMGRCADELKDELEELCPAMPRRIGERRFAGTETSAAVREQFCARCGARNAPGARFCSDCGAELTPPQVPGQCAKCGAQNDPSAKFCSGCGTALN